MINQYSKIKIRSGLQQNLPLLDKGELGWAVDTQRLFIGNGSLADGAPFVGNTEILTTPNSGASPNIGIPTGTIDGTNAVFTLPSLPIPNTLIVWKNFPLINGVGYTVSGTTITFTTPPQIGDNLYYMYWVIPPVPVPIPLPYFNIATVSGTVNGVNTTFTLSVSLVNPTALLLVLGGVVLNQDIDYSISGATITMNYAPTSGTFTAYYSS